MKLKQPSKDGKSVVYFNFLDRDYILAFIVNIFLMILTGSFILLSPKILYLIIIIPLFLLSCYILYVDIRHGPEMAENDRYFKTLGQC